MNVVLDKSYLRGAGKTKVSELCAQHNVLMPESLFFELLTTKDVNDRARCFGNLPDYNNPVMLVQGIGFMLDYECNHKRPIDGVKEIALDVQFIFNTRLKSLDFKFTDEQNQSTSEWKTDVAVRTKKFKERSACISVWFPRVKGYKPGSDPKHINEAKSLVCNDYNAIREIYRTMRPNNYPSPEILTPNWAIFRYLQVHIFAALEYIHKFGDGNSRPISDKIENEMLDLDYCVTALLVGALASHDKGLKNKFIKLQPSGMLIDNYE